MARLGRDVQVAIRLTTEVKEKFAEIAENYGMTVSALGAFIIGQYVHNQTKIAQPLQTKILESVTKAIGEESADMNEFMKTFMTSFMIEQSKKEEI